MKTVSFTDFRKRASGLIDEVELGETLIIVRHGKPVAEVTPYAPSRVRTPSWKLPIEPLEISGSDLSSAILEERDSSR